VTFELWDMTTKNMVFDWKTAIEAEASLRAVLSRKNVAALGGHALLSVDEDENSELVAEGEAMLVAIKRLAAEERAEIATPLANHRQVG